MADTLNISVLVNGSLQLSNPGVYEIVTVGPGERAWRRTTVEGKYQHGRKLIGAVLDTGSVTMVVRVYGNTWNVVNTRAKTMIDAVSRPSYTLQVTLDGVVNQWTCEPADISLVGGGGWQKFHAMARMQEYQLIIPRDPVPVVGGM